MEGVDIMANVNIDMWYGDKVIEADRIDISFCDLDSMYRGNIYKAGKIIGDYSTPDSIALEDAFPQLTFNWD